MTLSKKNAKKGVLSYRDAKKMIVVEIRGGKLSLCQVRNRSVQTGGSMGHRNLLATSFITDILNPNKLKNYELKQ